MKYLPDIVIGILLLAAIGSVVIGPPQPRAQTYGEQTAPPMVFFDTGIQANGGPVNSQDAAHGIQVMGVTMLNSAGHVYPSSTTGGSTQTYTNSPCTGTTTAQWVPVQIVGQTGTWYLAACQ
jgi:hypothetical protein